MPQVPYSAVPTIAPAMDATPTVHPNIGADAFGASQGAALQQFGGTLQQTGNQIFTRALAMKELDEQASVDNALTPVYESISNRMLEFRSKSGLEAKNDHPVFIKDIDSIIDKGAEGLSSDYAKQMYMKSTRHMRQVTVESAGAHAGVEFKNYLIGTEQARTDNAARLVTMHPTDDSLYQQGLKTIDDTSMDKLKGWGPEQRKSYVEEQRSALAYERARALNETDFKKAKEFLDSAVKNGEITGEKAAVISDQIRNRQNTVVSRVEGAKVLDGEGLYFGVSRVTQDRLYDAIIGTESSGNQYVVTPVVHKNGTKDRALGLGQILESNLAPWLKEAGMPQMSADAFLKDRESQIKLIKFKLSEYYNKYGSANEVAKSWRGRAWQDTTNGETEPEYLKRFNRQLAKSASRGDLDMIADKHSETLGLKEDPEFKFVLRDRMTAMHANDRKTEAETLFNNKHTVEVALGPDANGKLPTSPEEISDPAWHAAWEALPDYDKARYNKVFAKNAKDDYAPTTENQAEYRSWVGKMSDPMASAEDKAAAMDKDFMSMALPAAQRQQLVRMRAKLFGGKVSNPKLEHAMGVLQTQLYNAGVTRKQDEEGYMQFRGTLHEILMQQLEATGTVPNDKEIMDIGSRLLRETVTGKGWFGMDAKGPQFKTEVPENVAEKLKQSFIKVKGIEPTDAQLQQAYNVMIYTQLYGKKKEPVK